jgi:hypothetical protein
MGGGTVTFDPSVAVRRRHLPSFAGEEKDRRASKHEARP